MSKIVVLGAGGMAGHMIALFLREQGHEVIAVSAHHMLDSSTVRLDVTDTPTFHNFLDNTPCDIIINCIALLVKPSEERKDQAVYLNAFLPHFLEHYYAHSPTKIIHIGSDGVFSGRRPENKEDDFCDGESFYGRSKALGDIKNSKDLTLRLSIIGPDMRKPGQGLLHWFLQQQGTVHGYSNIFWNGITTLELAKAIDQAIAQGITGIYHLAPEESISKYDLLQLFQEVFQVPHLQITPSEGTGINSRLINTRSDFNYKVPGYKQMIVELKDWMEEHKEIYKHYGI